MLEDRFESRRETWLDGYSDWPGNTRPRKQPSC